MASSKLHPVNALNFDAVVLQAQGKVLVDFTAAWCGPCKAQSAILGAFAETSADVVVAVVDVDESPELASHYGVRGMPTLLAFDGGKETGRRLGLTNAHGVRALLATPAPAASSAVTVPSAVVSGA